MNFFVYIASVLVKKSKKITTPQSQAETMMKMEFGKLEMVLEEVVTRQEDDTLNNKKIARIKKLSTGFSRACVQIINRAHVRTRSFFGVDNLI